MAPAAFVLIMDEVKQISICNGNWARDWVFQTRTSADLDQQWKYAGLDKRHLMDLMHEEPLPFTALQSTIA